MTDAPSPLAISLLLVDDHPVMRVGLANVLSTKHGFRIVAQADDGFAGIVLWRKHRPDVCLLDVSMDGMDGIETLRRLRAEFPQARVLMLTSSKAAEDMELAMQSGAAGYVLKTIRHEDLAAAIRAVHRGETVTASLAAPSRKDSGTIISHRELEVLGLIRQGFSNGEIGQLLGISERTVRAHVTAILAALGAADRAAAVARGFELGLLELKVRPGL